MQPKPHNSALSLIIILVLIISPTFLTSATASELTNTTEYNNFVHTNISTDGNYTTVDKPIFPVMINSSQIQIGESWTITCPLEKGHKYHIYCFGSWVNTTAAAKTDYDIYVYDPLGNAVSHTETAGFPEHLGTTPDDPLYTAPQTGVYSFVIKNDDRQSEDAEQATFMIIESLECDKWYTTAMEGPSGGQSRLRTTWAHEFVTNQSTVELHIKVPDTLDMYEARLYLMNDAASPTLSSYPLPWEPGLYGNQTDIVGGYNFESEAYRGVAYASCEYSGQDMYLNYTSPSNTTKLYHLALIAEEGTGDIEFMLKSQFGNTGLTAVKPPTRVLPNAPAEVAYTSNNASLEFAQLSYTTDGWANKVTLNMAVSNQTCNATIPGQAAGSKVEYRIIAGDVLRNNMTATGEYTVKQQPTLRISIAKDAFKWGENVTVTGTLTPSDKSSKVQLQFMSFNSTQVVDAELQNDGSFIVSFQPTESGDWVVSSTASETATSWECSGSQLALTVAEQPLYVKYSLYIIIGLVVTCAVAGVVWFLKFRK